MQQWCVESLVARASTEYKLFSANSRITYLMWPFGSNDDSESDDEGDGESFRDAVKAEINNRRQGEGKQPLPDEAIDSNKSFFERAGDIRKLRQGEFDADSTGETTGEPTSNEEAVPEVDVGDVSPYEFELLVADLWDDLGWDTRVTRESHDRGIDIVATKQSPFAQKMLIQAKAYDETNKIGSAEVRKYATLYKQEPDADQIVIVTTSYFTEEATQLAADLNVKLVDKQDVLELCRTAASSE